MPAVDKPTIQYIVEEALASRNWGYLNRAGKSKRPIEDHSTQTSVESNEARKDRVIRTLFKKHRDACTCVNLIKSLGDAVLQATFVGGEPFVIMLGDDIMHDEVPLAKQLIEKDAEKTHASNIALQWKFLMKKHNTELLILKAK